MRCSRRAASFDRLLMLAPLAADPIVIPMSEEVKIVSSFLTDRPVAERLAYWRNIISLTKRDSS